MDAMDEMFAQMFRSTVLPIVRQLSDEGLRSLVKLISDELDAEMSRREALKLRELNGD